mgnify:CR=1 FL=1
MKPDTLSMLCDPITRDPLEIIPVTRKDRTEKAMINTRTRKIYPIREDIPVFIEAGEVTGLDRKFQKYYDFFAPFYDATLKLFSALKKVEKFDKVRKDYLKNLEAKDGDKVLEVSIGTGSNIRYMPPTCRFYGLDISWGMLMKCRSNMRKWNIGAELFLGNAERLPFRDESFDVVFHVGGINFFNDRAVAINEMIRVAKPGTKILIADETQKAVEGVYESPLWGWYFKDMEDMKSRAVPPVDLVPDSMQDMKVEYMMDDLMYCLYFRKPV